MIDFIKKFFKPEASGATARERLRLVLLSDHLSLAPDVVDALRADLIAVISKYVEVDEANCDVTFEQQDSAVAMLANIPILSMRSRPMAPPPAPPAPPAPTQETPSFGGAAPASASTRVEEPAPPAPKRRKRRRRAGTGSPSPATG
jgi:cell division topological specificity factor